MNHRQRRLGDINEDRLGICYLLIEGKKGKRWRERQVEGGTMSDRERWQRKGGKEMHKAFTHSSHYQLALQEGWGCHGDAEMKGLRWEQSNVPVG